MVAIARTGHPPEPGLLSQVPIREPAPPAPQDGGGGGGGGIEPNGVVVGLAVFLVLLAILSVSTLLRELFRDQRMRKRYTELADSRRPSMHQMEQTQALHATQLALRLEALQAAARTKEAVTLASRRIIELDDEVDRDVYSLCSRLRSGRMSPDEISSQLGQHRASVHDQLGDILRDLDSLRGARSASGSKPASEHAGSRDGSVISIQV